jgi:DNA-binding transcriptional MocR family regulator
MSDTGFAVIPIWLLRSPDFSHHAKTVFLHLSSRVNKEGSAWPSQETIAANSGLGERTVQRAVAELREAGLIQVVVEHTGAGRRNVYRLRVDKFGKGGDASEA